jgi:hypothetical protein
MDGSPWFCHLLLCRPYLRIPANDRLTAGNVVFSEIMLLPNGMSKGCG